jgi:hypothetical protein
MWIYHTAVAIWYLAKITALPMAVVTFFIRLAFGNGHFPRTPNERWRHVYSYRNRGNTWKYAPLSHAIVFFTLGGVLMLVPNCLVQWLGFGCVATGYIDWYCQFGYTGRARRHPEAY